MIHNNKLCYFSLRNIPSILPALLFCMTVLIGCDGVAYFSDGSSLSSGKEGGAYSSDVQDGSSPSHTEIFTVNATKTNEEVKLPLHILWVVDNSGTMKEEIKGVAKGIAQFSENLKNHTHNLEVSIISQITDKKTTGFQGFVNNMTKLVRPSKNRHFLPRSVFENTSIHSIPFEVGSKNQIHLLADYLSPKAKEDYGFIHSNIREKGFDLEKHDNQSFFRDPLAIKVFVVVTDEPEDPVGSELAGTVFVKLLEDQYGKEELSFFRFYGFLNKSDPNVNQSYAGLAKTLDGKNFDIKHAGDNWAEFFNQISKSLKLITIQRTFKLSKPVGRVVSVTVEGKALAKKNFRASNGKLLISPFVLTEGNKVKVVYQVQKTTK